MKRAAIYARFSSDLQNDRSIADQKALCREIAERESAAVVATFEDKAASAASTANRPGFLAMMAAAERRDFDVIIAEDVDRLSRDQGDWHAARKRLEFFGVSLHTVTGLVSRLDGSLRALMGEMYLENLALHVRRGLAGVVRDGRHAGGRAYGYTQTDKRGVLEINPDEAGVIREIFARYVGGDTPRNIAAALNERSIKPPRGQQWNASTINGSNQRGTGIIQNRLYAGELVWNRVRMVKDPATGKRVSRPNPPSEYKTADVQHLRIIDDKTWIAAQAAKRDRSISSAPQSRKPKRLLSGLLRCGSCGGGMSSCGPDRKGARLQCSNYRENGTCKNARKVYRDDVESEVMAGLIEKLSDPAWINHYIDAYTAARKRLLATATKERARLERRRGEITRELERAVRLALKGEFDNREMDIPVKDLRRERDELEAKLAELSEATPVIAIHPSSVRQYQKDLADLTGLLADDSGGKNDKLISAVRRLLQSVTVHAQTGQKGFKLEIKGRLSELLAASTPQIRDGKSATLHSDPHPAVGGIVGSGGGI